MLLRGRNLGRWRSMAVPYLRPELRALETLVAEKAKAYIEEVREGDRNDPELKGLLQDYKQAKIEGRLLDAIRLDSEIHERACYVVVLSGKLW